jgi:hypothetical protein
MYDFFRSSAIGMTTRVNIYNFLFKELHTESNDVIVTPKVNFKLSEKSTYTIVADQDGSNTFNLRFKKTCSEKEFKKIMEYFLQR